MAVARNWVVPCAIVHVMVSLPFGVHIGASDLFKLTHEGRYNVLATTNENI